ncbi:hypothetical protein MPLSOD_110072 [Mesorhizobium sp. SOD10]|nr:hypothetical protein MPLSOD_110072 [Mesorhizobium sp. SOD10]
MTTIGRLLARPALRDQGRMGLWFSADLDPSNTDAALALSSIGRRETVGMSFGFRPTKENRLEPEDYNALPERTILEAELFEISAVIRPAYPQSYVDVMRSDNAANARRRLIEKMEREHKLRGIR